LIAIKPLCTDDEYKVTSDLVADFIKPGGEGEELHSYLVARAESLASNSVRGDVDSIFSHHAQEYPFCSWLEEWWDKYCYLTDRSPLAIYINYFRLENV
jgi:carnitine O-acetyltransferase